MAYSLTDQYTLDVNWYFADRFNRLCVAASAGGVLPVIIAENDERNEQFHSLILDLPDRYKIVRNENILNWIEGVNQEGINAYFEDFESLAAKGFHVFDKVNLMESEDPNYILVAYPIYDPKKDAYPISRKSLSLIPRTAEAIDKRFFNPFDLIAYFNNLLP